MRTGNLLVSALADISGGRPLPNARQVSLMAGDPIPSEMLYGDLIFVIESGVAGNFLTMAETGRTSQVNMIGFEGIFPLAPLLNASGPRGYAIVPQLGNLTVNLVEAKEFQAWMGACEKMQRILLQYLYFQMAEKNVTIYSKDYQSVDERVSRALLMCHDRTFGDIVHVTHDELAQMVSSFRPTVTNVVNNIQQRGAIKLYRGKIQILDRASLIETSDGSYGDPEKFYSKHICKFGKECGETPVKRTAA